MNLGWTDTRLNSILRFKKTKGSGLSSKKIYFKNRKEKVLCERQTFSTVYLESKNENKNEKHTFFYVRKIQYFSKSR
jgi:hypothetical protein